MKKLFISLVAFLLFAVGCAPMLPLTPSMNQGEERIAGIGDTFFIHAQGQSMKDPFVGEIVTNDSSRYDLTILELTQEKIGFQYNEYFYEPGRTVGYQSIPGGWMVKQGYNKRFDYAVADKIVRFKGYEFEILSVENGQIKYRRIK